MKESNNNPDNQSCALSDGGLYCQGGRQSDRLVLVLVVAVAHGLVNRTPRRERMKTPRKAGKVLGWFTGGACRSRQDRQDQSTLYPQ